MDAVASDSRSYLTTELGRLVGTRTANALAKLDLATVGDLLALPPRRYMKRGELVPLASITEGESVTVVARVLSATLRPMNARRGFLLTVRIADSLNELSLTFFGKSRRPLAFHESKLTPGTLATFSGTVGSYRGALQLTHPDYEVIEDEADVDPVEINRPIPIYPSSVGVPTWTIARAIGVVLDQAQPGDIPDVLPEDYRQKHQLVSAYDAVVGLHRPVTDDDHRKARLTLAHEEAFVLQSYLAQRAAAVADEESVPRPYIAGGLLDAFDQKLPFELTEGQETVGREISEDLASSRPMNRLLQGDVGSGKTIVALRAMCQVVESGGQAALLAPTEVLAHQHYRSMSAMLGELGLGMSEASTRIDLLTGSMSAPAKRTALARLAGGETGIIVGTHALLSDNVQIPFLSLAVVDEQHRFGVDQRDSLRQNPGVNLLVMTATPIPRTIAMTAFGDLDVSELTELPRGRAEVTTTIVPATKQSWVDRVWHRAAEEIEAGGRVYVICPRISPTETETPLIEAESDERPPLTSVTELADALQSHPVLGRYAIGQLTGPMSAEEKGQAMADFESGVAPVLVATTVVEVGVDVPAATMMVIMDADRFGLSQLHQLRGRIGRGTKPGICLALSHAEENTVAAKRLNAFASTRDGFELARTDLELRREGDVLGSAQSGTMSHLRHLSVLRDGAIIEAARSAARHLISEDPDLSAHGELAAKLASLEADYIERT